MNRRTFLRTSAARAFAGGLALPAVAAWDSFPGGRGRAGAPIVGINAHILTAEYIRHLHTLGIRHVRTTLLWPLWREDASAYRAAWQEVIDRSTDAGLRLLVVAHNWPSDRPVVASGVDREMMDRFADFIADQARRYPGVEAWQLWNEQDLWVQAPFGAGRGVPMRKRGANYAEQLRLAYPRIKQANRRALVVTGGTAEHPARGFLAGMMADAPPCDAVAVHAYGPWEQARDRIVAARRLVGSHAPIWVTECGSRSHEVTEGRQVADWRSLLGGNDEERLAARLYPYALLSTAWGHSLLGPKGARREAYGVMQRYMRERVR